jgi:hypothetical protein
MLYCYYTNQRSNIITTFCSLAVLLFRSMWEWGSITSDRVQWCGLDRSGSGLPVEGSCERGNEPSGSIKCWNILSSCTISGFSRRAQLRWVSEWGPWYCLCIKQLPHQTYRKPPESSLLCFFDPVDTFKTLVYEFFTFACCNRIAEGNHTLTDNFVLLPEYLKVLTWT